MINEKDILAMLQNGESADDIAQKLVDTLNKGKELYNEELAAKAKADEEAKAKAANELEKQEDMADILDAIYQFVFKWYCEDDKDIAELDEIFADVTPKDVIKMIEEAGSVVLEMTNLFDMFNSSTKKKNKKPSVFKFEIDNKADADFVINSFLKSIGL